MLADGTTYGPMAAGVRSIAWMPACSYRGALSRWTYAYVASKTRSGFSDCDSSQSTPSALASRPASRARCSPSDAGSTPIIQRGSIELLRNSFASRSVPMLPEPTMAAVTMECPSSDERDGDGAEAGEGRDDGVARRHVVGAGAGAGQYDVAGFEAYAERRDLLREPRDGDGRVAEDGIGAAGRDLLAVAGEGRVDGGEVELVGLAPLLAE